MREIVDGNGGVTKKIHTYISKIIKTYVGQSEYAVKNSHEFVENIKDQTVEEGEELVSYDVRALYPSVPQNEAIDLVHKELIEDEGLASKTTMTPASITQLFRTIVKKTYFVFNKKLYTQVDGLAIGASTSGFAADIFMCHLEKRAISTFVVPPSIWIRYVDDTFAKLRKEHVSDFMKHLNDQHQRIDFTTEKTQDNKIAFLDTNVKIEEDGRLTVTIYRKPTHTDQYLAFGSNHHIRQKLGIVSTFRHRIETLISKDEDKKEETERMEQSMKECGYPEWALDRNRNTRKNKENADEFYATVSIPYTEKVSPKIASIYKKYNVRATHKPTTTIKQLLCKPKDEVHPYDKTGAIYEVTCEKHGETYIGETQRALKQRAYEHGVVGRHDSLISHSIKEQKTQAAAPEMAQRRSSRLQDKDKIDYAAMHTGSNIPLTEGSTVVSKHKAGLDHEPGDLIIKPIAHEQGWQRRVYREALEIRKRSPTLNEEQGSKAYIPPIYNLILKTGVQKSPGPNATRPPRRQDNNNNNKFPKMAAEEVRSKVLNEKVIYLPTKLLLLP